MKASVTVQAVVDAVCKKFELESGAIRKKTNKRGIVFPRHIASYLLTGLADHSLTLVAREFGRKHHTTIMHSRDLIAERRKTDTGLNQLLNELSKELGLSQNHQ